MPVKHLVPGRERLDRLTTWLDEKLTDIQDARTARESNWVRYRELYEAKSAPKHFPWRNASNVVIPLVAITTDAIHANMMNRVLGHERIWDVSAVRPTDEVGVDPETEQPITWDNLARSVQDYMKVESEPSGYLDIYGPLEDGILECIKLGTAVLYNPWTTDTIPGDFVQDNDLNIIQQEDTVEFEGIRPQLLALDDFEILPNYPDIVGPYASPLFGHRYLLRPGQLAANFKAGLYRGGSKLNDILGSPGVEEPHTAKDQQSRLDGEVENYTDTRAGDFELRDLWIRWPWRVNGAELRIFVTYHKKSRSVLALRPWPYKSPPYHVMRYLRREHRFYGMGIPEILESLQRGITTSFNQSVDNATIANMRGVKVKHGSPSAQRLGDFYPGRRFVVGEMDEIDTFQLGEVYPSAFQIGLLFRDFGERRSGIADYNLGRESDAIGKHSTATTTLALLQENARRFDLYSKDIRRAIGRLGMQSLELIQQYQPTDKIYAMMGVEKGEQVANAVVLPNFAKLQENLRVSTTTAASSSNKEVERQNAITAFSVIVQYLERIFQLATVMVNPQVPPPLQKLAYDMTQTAERLMQRVLEGFELPDIATFLPQLEGLRNANAQQPGAPQAALGEQGALGALGGAAPGGEDPFAALAPGGGSNGADEGGGFP